MDNLHIDLGVLDIKTKYSVSVKNKSLVSKYTYPKNNIFDKYAKVITDKYSSIFEESNIGYIICNVDNTITIIKSIEED